MLDGTIRWASAVILALGASACGSDEGGSDGPDPVEAAGPMDQVESPERSGATEMPAARPVGSLSWRSCGALECAEVTVPIDDDAPELGTLSVAINRVRASASEPYRGVILLNPGGPGVPGKPLVEASAATLPRLFPGFDLVGFDPRGTGESAPLGCALNIDPAVVYAEGGVEALLRAYATESERCAAEAGPLFQYVGSQRVVADMDAIREALGHEQINFIGISYGTRLGALYAKTFPERLRALVLDAPTPPSSDIIEEIEGQFEALLAAHAAFFAACAGGTLDCPPDGESVFANALASADAAGQRAQFLGVWALLLSSPPGRDQLIPFATAVAAGALTEPMSAGTDMLAEPLAGLNILVNFNANCADDTAGPLSVEEGDALMASFEERSALFGVRGLPALTCSGWRVRSEPVLSIASTPSTAPIVIGGLSDSLTPLHWAEETAALIPGAALLLSDHYGHGATVFGGLCVFNFLRRYFETLELPPLDARCPAP